MSDRRKHPTLLAVLVLVSLVVLTLDYRQGEDGFVAALQRGALTVFGPVQDGFATAMRPVGGVVRSVTELGRLRDENAALREELERLREGRVSRAGLERENRQLRELLAMRERLELTTTGAEVIAQPPGLFERSVLIDAGSASGVARGMAVINEHGLVGKVTEVTRSHARVELVTSARAGYVVRLADTDKEGLLRGRGSRPFQLEMTDAEVEVDPDSEVVTRNFRGSTIPDGIPVGIVEERPETEAAGDALLSVTPYVDFSRLRLVQVVLDAPEQPSDLDPDDVETVPEELPDPPVTDGPEEAGEEGPEQARP